MSLVDRIWLLLDAITHRNCRWCGWPRNGADAELCGPCASILRRGIEQDLLIPGPPAAPGSPNGGPPVSEYPQDGSRPSDRYGRTADWDGVPTTFTPTDARQVDWGGVTDAVWTGEPDGECPICHGECGWNEEGA